MIKRWVLEPCWVCGENEPHGKYHEFPWHLTCSYDNVGKKKVNQWHKEQKKVAQSELPTLI